MEPKYERGILRISAVCLIAAALVIPWGFLDVAPSPAFPVAFAVATAALYYAWQESDAYGTYLSGLWLGPAIATVVALAAVLMGASAGEFQTLGGLVGLVGVGNLLLRPVYRIVHYVVAGALQIGREIQEERS